MSSGKTLSLLCVVSQHRSPAEAGAIDGSKVAPGFVVSGMATLVSRVVSVIIGPAVMRDQMSEVSLTSWFIIREIYFEFI